MPLLHVANGHSTTALIRRAGLEGDLSIWADVLHEGPVPGAISYEALRDVRAAYLAEAFAGETYEKTAAELRSWDAALMRREPNEEIVLWFEHDLFDQLNLIQLLDRLAARESVSLICIGTFPGKPGFKGLGELTPGELASLWESRRPVTESQYALARRTWAAFRASTPQPLESLLSEDLSALPFLGSALRRHLEEFPWVDHGLSRTEARLLAIAGESPVEIRKAFSMVHEGETCFYLGDLSFWRIVRELARCSLVQIQTDKDVSDFVAGGPVLPLGTIATTTRGLAVLENRMDRIKDSGIDRWLGGIHLTGRGPTWRWDHQNCYVVWR